MRGSVSDEASHQSFRLDSTIAQEYNAGMTIEINPNQDALHLSLSETTLQQMCNVQKLTATNRKKILALLDKALPELVQDFLDESVEVQGLITKNPITTGFKPVYVNFEKPLALWGEEDGVDLPDGTVFYVDGYSFGDRLLERVMFKCALLDGGTSGVVFGPEYDAYTASLNMKMWMNLCAEQLSQMDIVSGDISGKADFCLVEKT